MNDIELLYKVWDSGALYELQTLNNGNTDYDSILFEREYLPVLQEFGLIIGDDKTPIENVQVTELGRRVCDLSQSDVVETFNTIEGLADHYGIDAIPDLNQMVLACAKKIEVTE